MSEKSDSELLTNLRWHALHANDRAHDLYKAVDLTQRRGEPMSQTPRLTESLAKIAEHVAYALHEVTELQQRASAGLGSPANRQAGTPAPQEGDGLNQQVGEPAQPERESS